MPTAACTDHGVSHTALSGARGSPATQGTPLVWSVAGHRYAAKSVEISLCTSTQQAGSPHLQHLERPLARLPRTRGVTAMQDWLLDGSRHDTRPNIAQGNHPMVLGGARSSAGGAF